MHDDIFDKPMDKGVVMGLTTYLLVVTVISAYIIISLWTSQRP